jgi:hypothetical protein
MVDRTFAYYLLDFVEVKFGEVCIHGVYQCHWLIGD